MSSKIDQKPKETPDQYVRVSTQQKYIKLPKEKHLDFDLINRHLLSVLAREARQLVRLSSNGPLNRDQSTSLVNYIKLIKELKKDKAKELEEMPLEELEKIANSGDSKQVSEQGIKG